MYEIRRDYKRRRIVVLLDGYEDHDRPQFQHDVKAAALSVKGGADHFDILADFSNSSVMPRAIADDSEDIAVWFLENGLRRSANVSQSITQRMQIRRVTEHNDLFAMFGSRAEAERWLDKQDAKDSAVKVRAAS